MHQSRTAHRWRAAWAAVATATIGLSSAGLSSAADDPPAAPPARAAAPASTDPLGAARAHITAKRWRDAITELRRVNATSDANWNNLMGYSLRKQATPDLDGAQRHYDAALRIDPRHKGALEYAGELALMKGDAATARQRMATLQQVCPQGCEELADLQRAVQRFEANGNRYVPE
jgi:Flp pilus assembly protein TadD